MIMPDSAMVPSMATKPNGTRKISRKAVTPIRPTSNVLTPNDSQLSVRQAERSCTGRSKPINSVSTCAIASRASSKAGALPGREGNTHAAHANSAAELPVLSSSAAAVAAALTDDTALVSVMLANNDVGTLQPIAAIAAVVGKGGKTVPFDGFHLASTPRVLRDGA